MKKFRLCVLTAVMAISMSTFAYAHCGKRIANNQPKYCVCNESCSFVDINEDGICDNCNYIHEAGRGRNFIDVNEDGICDNCNYSQNQKENCTTNVNTSYSFKHHRHRNR